MCLCAADAAEHLFILCDFTRKSSDLIQGSDFILKINMTALAEIASQNSGSNNIKIGLAMYSIRCYQYVV